MIRVYLGMKTKITSTNVPKSGVNGWGTLGIKGHDYIRMHVPLDKVSV